nr:MAG TPA: hypothetical protein [Caudoviricetes sp.]
MDYLLIVKTIAMIKAKKKNKINNQTKFYKHNIITNVITRVSRYKTIKRRRFLL